MTEPLEPDTLPGLGEAYRKTPSATEAARRALLARLGTEAPPRRRGFSAWLPLTPWLRPLSIAAAAALLVLTGYGLSYVPRPESRGTAGSGREEAAPGIPSNAADVAASREADRASREVEFVLVAGSASRVSVVGDFNGWDATRTPMRRVDSGSTWTASVPLPEGTHAYAFVVDGWSWVNDPTAPLALADDFGATHSVLVVRRGGS